MSKVKSSEIPHYELLYIISNKFSENELAPIVEMVHKTIKDNNGGITHTEDWGKKRFAYPIGHFHHGYYNLVEFDVAGEKLAKIDKALRLASEILRHQIVKKKIKTKEEIEQEKKIAEKIAAKKEEKEEKEKITEKEKIKGKTDLKDLDEKLDEILKSEDLL